MHEILKKLQADSFVLDLGSATGSFPQNATLANIVRGYREVRKVSRTVHR